ncbi:tape measure protein [Siminovitchia terrae]|uniref:tape measure protein n=1 Tax=Siminovitchia terrae TaxID=1914933 RepID=UPI0028B181DA|nr:tape measure protein [Siminovitchia terrae]
MADGTIKIEIEVDGKQISVASKELDKLEEAGLKSGKGIKAAESGMDSLSDSSSKAGSSVKGAKDAIDNLGDSGSKAGQGLKGAEGAVDGLSDSSSNASSSVKGAGDAIDGLGDSGSKVSKELSGVDGAIDGLSDSSTDVASNVKGAKDAIDGLGDSGAKVGKELKGADGALDGLSDSSTEASSSVKGAKDAIDSLGDTGSQTAKDLKGVDSAIDGLSDGSSEAAKSVKGTSDSLGDLSGKAGEAAESARKVQDETEGIGQGAGTATLGIKGLVASLGLVAIASKAFDVMKSSLDSAIARFDTLNAFPKVLQELGVSAEDSERAVQKLGDGIDGLPTTLNDIAASAQRMYTSFSDIDKATDMAIALNNALLGSGSSAEQAKRGTDQYIKALQTGKINMDTWNTLSETMDVGLIKLAEGFGYAGKSAKDDLYKALQDGTVTLDQFNDKLIELGTGTGTMAKLARENSLGVATSIGNLQNAASRGVANIIDAFNRLSKEATGKDIAQNIDSLKGIVNESFKLIVASIEGATPFVKAFGSTVQATIPVVQALSPVLIGLAAAYGSFAVISKVTGIINASNATLALAMSSTKGLTIATNAQIASKVSEAAVTAAVNAAKQKNIILTQAEQAAIAKKAVADKAAMMASAAELGLTNARSVATGVLTGQMTISAGVTAILTAATNALGAAIKFLMGPIGWVVAGIGLLVAGTIALVKWFNKASEDSKKLNAETEELSNSVGSLKDDLNNSATAYKDNQTEIQATAKANEELAKKIDELAGKEKKTAAEKELLRSYVDELNGSMEGLNLTYDEEANKLSMSSEQLKSRIDLMREQEKAQEAQTRLTEILKEQAETEEKLKDAALLRQEWNQKLEEGSVKGREHKKALEELGEQEESLRESNKQLAVQQKETEEQLTNSINAVTEATKKGVTSQTIAFEELSESQQATVENMKSTWEDYKAQATDMFDRLSEKSEISVNKMTKNLEENQRIITNWSENIAKLAERGVDEGLLNTLREAGPESAGHVNALVKASDSELQKLSDAFAKGGDVATDALSTSLGIEKSGVMEAVGHLVTDTESSLKQQINAADFKSIGNAVPEGLAEGIQGGSENAKNASKKMSDDTTKASKQALGVNSPSRVFKEIGTNITEGLVLGINQGTSKVVQAVQKMFKSVETNSTNSFKTITRGYDNAVKQIETTLAKLPQVTQKAMQNMTNRLKSGSQAQLSAMKSLSQKYDQSVKQIDKSLNKLPKVAQKAMSDMLNRLKSGGNAQLNTMRSLARAMPIPFNSLPGQMRSVGLHAMSGLNSGLNAGSGHVMSTARGIANRVASTMRQALKIHSPSRVTKEIGKFAGQGVVKGLASTKKGVAAASKNVANEAIKNLQFKYGTKKIGASNYIAELKKIQKAYKLTGDQARKVQKEIYQATQSITKQSAASKKAAASAAKKASDNAMKNLQVKFDTKKINPAQYIAGLRKIRHQYKLTGDQNRKLQKEMYRANQAIMKQAEAQNKSIKKINDGVKKADSAYLKKVKSINSNLANDIKKAQDDYKNKLADLTKSLYNQTGLFDKIKVKRVDANKLLKNLKDQNAQFKQFNADIAKIQKAGVSKKFVNELREMGVDAAAEINAIANMPKSMLKDYVKAWSEKHKLAKDEATKQMADEKKNMQKRIKSLTAAAKKELIKAKADWRASLIKLSDETKKLGNFKNSGKVLGKNTVQGLIKGLKTMKGPLAKESRALAKTIEKEVKKALKIKSPSQLMRDEVGKMITAGIAVGIDKDAKTVYKALDNLSQGMILTSSPEAALGTSRMGYANSSNQVIDALRSFKTPPGNQQNDDSETKSLLNRIVKNTENISGDIYFGPEKVGGWIDRNQAKRTGMYGRRIAID